VTRIVGGTAGGRRLEVPKGDETRPTSEMVREALFGALDARGAVRGARVLDLFAGSGALGLEAASRGAADVVLVDASRQATVVARRNVAAIGLPRVAVVLSSVERYLAGRPAAPQHLVLLDPPYGIGEDVVAAVLRALVAGSWLAADATVVVERSSRNLEPRWPEGLERTAVRRYGETTLWTAHPTATVPAGADAEARSGGH
jgi:16S rRNA (guanine966-N2)-methyltransferase